MNAAVKPGMSTADAGKAQREEIGSLEKECSAGGMRCDVVTLYSGAMYNLYKYKKYDDIRLVFAPEFDIAFFGGDPDNFEYPRYDLDISFFRAYENGEPAKTQNYLKWSPNGASDNELIFVSGHPGRTGRLLTMDQLDFLRDYQYPAAAQLLHPPHRCAAEVQRAIRGERARGAERCLRPAELVQGRHRLQGGLKDPEADGEEGRRRKRVCSSSWTPIPKRKQQFGDPWAAIAKAVDVQKQIYKPLFYLDDNLGGFRGDLAAYARVIVRAAYREAEAQQPAHPRLSGCAVAHRWSSGCSPPRPSTRRWNRLSWPRAWQRCATCWAPTIPMCRRRWPARRPRSVPRKLIDGTKLDDVAVRKQLYEGGRRRSTPAPIR